MLMSEQFQSSRELYPNGGVLLPRSACGFILPEIEEIINKYETEIADPKMSETLRRMCVHHLEGLKDVHRMLKEGYEKKE